MLPIRRETKSEKSEVVKEKKQREKLSKNYPGGDSAVDPPETIPNSEVKRCNADGSVGFPHVRVGHRQVSKYINRIKQSRIKDKNPQSKGWGFFYL